MTIFRHIALVLVALSCASLAFAQGITTETSKTFHVKYVTADAVYIDAGSAAGLEEGHTLIMKRPAPGESPSQAKNLAVLVVTSVASASAVCDIRTAETKIEAGDLVMLSYETRQQVVKASAGREAESYPQVVMFTGFDPLEEELHAQVPKPPLHEVNRANGRIAFDYDAIRDKVSGSRSAQKGLVVRLDMTRIGATHWSLTGYWRGRLSARSTPSADTLRDAMNRVYQFGLQYASPDNPYVAGAGRLLLPWASSISTFDGGYFGRKISKGTVAGLFAGSTPDPTAWNYDPNREIAGAFISNNHGSFTGLHRTHTAGIALTRLHWQADRQYVFAENDILFRSVLSIHHNLEGDYLSKGRFSDPRRLSLTRSFLTLRVQPVPRITFNVSHNYFRVLPTFDPLLLSTGLLDSLLFQGFSGGVRLDLPGRVSLYSDYGQSHSSTDQKKAGNVMYGMTLGNVPVVGVHVDVRHSQFSSAAGSGVYDSISLVRQISDRLRLNVMSGLQRFQSLLIQNDPTRFVTADASWLIGRHAMFGVGASRYRGSQSYDQINGNLGYRF